MADIEFVQNGTLSFLKEAICLLINTDLMLTSNIIQFDQKYNGIISKFLQHNKVFRGKFGEVKVLTTIVDNSEIKTIILLGIGHENLLSSFQLEELGGIMQKCMSINLIKDTLILIDHDIASYKKSQIASLLASGFELASYRFNKYFTNDNKEDSDFELVDTQKILISFEDSEDIEQAKKAFAYLKAVKEGVFLTRDLTSAPPNELYPATYASRIQELEGLDIKVEIIGEREIYNLGMGALFGVGQGSQRESKLVSMYYQGTDDKKEPIAFVGKGVTFDSGGLSLKPSNSMADMKYDMAGSAAVVGTIKALALRKAKVNVVGVIALVENMPGSNAQRPSDIVKTMSGQTVEILNTDAEGRLILADALWYAQDKFKPKCVIDLATLTGAITVALGNTYAGCFSNNTELSIKLQNAGQEVNEKLWIMPLHKDYDDMIKSDIADMANIGNVSGAGSCTAASFLQKFIQKNIPWAHLDIAGVAWSKKGSHIYPKGAVGFGVRLLNQFVKDNYEDN